MPDASSCAFNEIATCLAAEGCAWVPEECVGQPDICPMQTACVTAGCAETGACGGTHADCTTYPNNTECTSHDCTVTTSVCVGVTHGCEAHGSAVDCTLQGCNWVTGLCGGTPAPCSTHTESSCGLVQGCIMRPAECQNIRICADPAPACEAGCTLACS